MNTAKDRHQGTKMSNKRCYFTMLHSLFIIGLLLCSSTTALAQNCQPTSIIASTPTADFIVNGDGTVTHKKTGLMWKVCSEGQTWSAGSTCTGSATAFTWQPALQLTPATFATFADWRVPNKKELASIVEVQCVNPSINAAIFPATIGQAYWSASPYASNAATASFVDFSSGRGSFSGKNFNYVVRLVRGGQ